MEILCQYRWSIVFILISSLFCASQKATEEDLLLDRYFPTVKEHAIKYIEKEYIGGAEYTHILTHRIIDEFRGEKGERVFKTNPTGLFPIYDKNGIAKAGAYIVKDNKGAGITVVVKNDQPVYPSRLYYLLKKPLRMGNSWRNRAHFLDLFGQKFTITDTEATVELKDGTRFENCIEVSSEYKSEGRRYLGKQWFAPGVGMVRSAQWRLKEGKKILIYEIYIKEIIPVP